MPHGYIIKLNRETGWIFDKTYTLFWPLVNFVTSVFGCVGIGAASPLPADGHGYQPGGGAATDGGSGWLLRHLYEWGRARRDPGAHQVHQVGGFLAILHRLLWGKKQKTNKQRKVQIEIKTKQKQQILNVPQENKPMIKCNYMLIFSHPFLLCSLTSLGK